MKRAEIEQLIAEYLHCPPEDARSQEIARILVENGVGPNELKKFREAFTGLETVRAPEPPERMHRNFYAMLEEQIRAESSARRKKLHGLSARLRRALELPSVPKLAYGAALILFGWFLGYLPSQGGVSPEDVQHVSAQMRELRTVMALSLLDHQSAVKRITAVNMTADIRNIDERIVGGLLHTLNNDPNANVRLAAADVLKRMANDPSVRRGLVESIGSQDTPVVQIALTDIIVELNERSAVEELQTLLQRPGLYYSVRDRVKTAIQMLS